MNIRTLALPISLILTAASPLLAEADRAEITVDAGKILGPVNPRIFGQNLETADTKGIFGPSTQKAKIKTGEGMWDVEGRTLTPEIGTLMRDANMGMLRYPGGCLAHNFDWKKTVGPREKRGDWQFGLDEYLEACRLLKVEPLITISDYVLPADEMPKHAAELVEYLNAPATPEHPWAIKRQEWGHPEPYGVKWFELGNESDHGNHQVKPRRQFTPEAYAKYARETAAAMRAVDPTIKIGIVTVPGIEYDNPWTIEVLKQAGDVADFVVIHFYSPVIGETVANSPDGEALAMQSCLASGDQLEWLMGQFRKTIKEACGRDLPLAMTEYNVGCVIEKPKPYRYSYGAGLLCADLLRIFLKPETHMEMANYWQMVNGYWGMIDNQDKPMLIRPAYPLYKLWGQHFGADLVAVEVRSPKETIPAYTNMMPASGDKLVEGHLIEKYDWADSLVPALARGAAFKTTKSEAGGFRTEIAGHSGNVYPAIGNLSAPAETKGQGCSYLLEYEGKYTPDEGTQTARMGLGIVDARGWDVTHSGTAVDGMIGPEWKKYRKWFHASPDAPGVSISLRLEPEEQKLSGVLEIRNLNIEAHSKTQFPAYDLITASASISEDRSKLYLVVFNKSADRPIEATIQLRDFVPAGAKAWEVNAPKLASLDGAKEVRSGEDIPLANGAIHYKFPAHSMTAIEVARESLPPEITPEITPDPNN